MPRPSFDPNKITASIVLNRQIYELYKMSDIGQVMTPPELINAVLAISVGIESPEALYHEAWINSYKKIKEIVQTQIKDRLESKTEIIKLNVKNLPYYDLIYNFMLENSLKDNKLVSKSRYNNRLLKIINYELNLGKFEPNDETNILYDIICDEIFQKYPNLIRD